MATMIGGLARVAIGHYGRRAAHKSTCFLSFIFGSFFFPPPRDVRDSGNERWPSISARLKRSGRPITGLEDQLTFHTGRLEPKRKKMGAIFHYRDRKTLLTITCYQNTENHVFGININDTRNGISNGIDKS